MKNAKASWEPRTGGKVEISSLDFGDVPIKYAGVIASQDSSVDVVYTYAGFMGQFGERLYDDIGPLAGDTSAWLPSTLGIMSPAGVLRALPVHSETEIFIYNKEHFEAAGADPDNIPQTWDELYALAPKLTSGNRYPCVAPWIAPTGRKSILYWLVYYNSFPDAKFVSDDNTQVLFDNDAGLKTWQAIERGFKAKFFDPVGVSLANDYESGLVFNQGQSASQINYSELWGQAVSGNTEDFKATISADVVGASVMPGVDSRDARRLERIRGLRRQQVQHAEGSGRQLHQGDRRVRRPEGDEHDEDPAVEPDRRPQRSGSRRDVLAGPDARRAGQVQRLLREHAVCRAAGLRRRHDQAVAWRVHGPAGP